MLARTALRACMPPTLPAVCNALSTPILTTPVLQSMRKLPTPCSVRRLHDMRRMAPCLPALQGQHTTHLPVAPQWGLQFKTNRVSPISAVPIRGYNLHEYQSLDVFKEFKVDHGKGLVARTPEQAEEAAKEMKGDCVVKAQVLTGGRGKGHFDNGFKGGVHLCTSPAQAKTMASKMLGARLITKQTGPEGKPCNAVMVAERLFLRRETYFAILMDRQYGGPVMVASPSGGMDIEAVAEQTPDLIFKEPIDITKGYRPAQLERLATACGFTETAQCQAAMKNYGRLYDLFMKSDCTLVEINPFAETHDGRILCLDAKLNFDDNAAFRQKKTHSSVDKSQVDPRELQAEEVGFNFIALDGNIGCMVNGAGLAMATMDVIKLHGGNPANFLDLGGGASDKQVASAFALLNGDPSVRAILVNIFGGIVRCDHIALGIIRASQEVGLRKPVVIRLQGTNVQEAKRIIEESGLRMLLATDLNEAAKQVVRVVDIVQMAEDAHMKVSFELPL